MAEVTKPSFVEQLQEIQARYRMTRPFWQSGAAWLASLAWINLFALFWVIMFDLLPEQINGPFVGFMVLLFFLLAIGASMVAYGK